MSHRLTSMTSLAPGAPQTARLNGFPDKNHLLGIWMRFAYPITAGGFGAPATPTLEQIVAAAIQSLTVRVGVQGRDSFCIPYNNIRPIAAEYIHRLATKRDLPNNNQAFAVADGPHTILFDLFIPIGGLKGIAGGRKKCLGWSQARTIEIVWQEGAALAVGAGITVTRTVGAALNVDVDVETIAASEDQWGIPLSYYEVNSADFFARSPEGIHVFAWDENAPTASSAITTESIDVGATNLCRDVPPYVLQDEYLDEYDDGVAAADISTAVTPHLTPKANQDVDTLPAGELTVRWPSKFYTMNQLRGLYWPYMTEAAIADAVAHVATKEGEAVLATSHDDSHKVSHEHALAQAVVFHKASNPEFTLRSGLIAEPNKKAIPTIPVHKRLEAEAAIAHASKSGSVTGESAKAQVMENIARSIPGLAHRSGVKSGQVVAHASSAFASALRSVAGPRAEGEMHDLLKRIGL